MKKHFTIFILFCTFSISFGQWSASGAKRDKIKNTSDFDQYFTLDLYLLKAQLAKAQLPGQYSKAVEILIPVLGSGIETFEVYSLPVVVPELAAKYDLGSYVGVAKNDPSKYIRFSLAPGDFQSMIIINGVSQFIEPLNKEKSIYRVFPKTVNTGNKILNCTTEENSISKQQIEDLSVKGTFLGKSNITDFSKNSDKKYRTLRLAMSVVGEYTIFFGGVSGAMTAINATLTRVNGVFEKDFAVHLTMQNFPMLIYSDGATDPYSDAITGSYGTWNQELQTNLTNTIGNATYDIGHLFSPSGGGGNSGCIGCVCINPTGINSTQKGSGFTSASNNNPQGDTFDIDFVAHEMGHQLGATHTFTYTLQNANSSMEPGSGSTIMGYAGVTGPNNDVQSNKDPYFHISSISKIQNNLNSKTCDVETTLGNNPPVIAALPAYTIPKGTAFVLSATVSDPENDPMTFTWEEVDNSAIAINKFNIGNTSTGPTFRSVPPTTNGSTRYFPRLSSVLAGVLDNSNNLWEAVPTIARNMAFAITVRDNNPAFNQQQTASLVQNMIIGNDGPFTVNSTVGDNNVATPVTWTIANTNVAPYNVANVKIDYTTNDGVSWINLIASTANDGSENVIFTGVPTNTSVKLRVSAIGNVFYAVNTVNILSSISETINLNNGVQIYPNPVSDILNITYISDSAMYVIYSVAGQIIRKGTVKDGKIVVRDLITGNYILKITDKDVEQSFKFIKR